jgi:hypothetical protein
MVSLTFASWNQIAGWLRRLEGLLTTAPVWPPRTFNGIIGRTR